MTLSFKQTTANYSFALGSSEHRAGEDPSQIKPRLALPASLGHASYVHRGFFQPQRGTVEVCAGGIASEPVGGPGPGGGAGAAPSTPPSSTGAY